MTVAGNTIQSPWGTFLYLSMIDQEFKPAVLQGLWFRARAAVLDQQDAKTTGYQFGLIINWERDLL